MLKFMVKNDKGELIEATQDQILSPDTLLFAEDGTPMNRKNTSVVDPDPVKELTGLVKELALSVGSLSGIKEKTEENERKIAAYQEAAQKGFPIPVRLDKGLTATEGDEIFAPYDLARQGKRLTDKLYHPKHQIADDRRKEIAEYFILFLKAAVGQDYHARVSFADRYGSKTALGDTGNIFPVPDIVDEEILYFAREASVVLQEGRLWDMTSEKQSFPAESTAATTNWGNTTSEGTPIASEVELDAEELSSYSVVRDSTLADARSDIVSWLTEAMAEAAALELDNSAFNGDGTSTYGGCSGILSAACGYSVVMSAGSTSFSQLGFADLSEMQSKLDGLKKQGAKYWMNGAILHYVRTMVDDQNRPIFIETVGSAIPPMILGYPYKEVVKMPSTDAANTAFLAYGNLRYFAVGRRLGVTTLKVDPFGLFTTNRTRFKLYQRWGLKIALAEGLVRMLTAAA